MRYIFVLFLLLPFAARAQTDCSPQSQTDILNSMSDTAAAGSITPQTLRNFVCSTLQINIPMGQIYVGSSSGLGAAVTPSGDLTMSPLGVFTLGTLNAKTLTNSTITGGTISGANASGANVTATGTATARTTAARAADLVNVKDGYGGQPGAKGDGQIASPVVTLSGTSLTMGAATFAAADVGKVIVITGAGAAATTGIVAAVPVTTPGSGYTSVPTCTITDASSTGAGATCVALMSLQSATLVSGGLGCLTGAFEMTVGTDGLLAASVAAGMPNGTPAKITGTITGGSVTGSVVVKEPGMLGALGNLATAPGYGANCTTAPTFALSYGVAGIQITNTSTTAYSTTQTSVALSGGSPTVAATVGTPVVGVPNAPLVTTIAGFTSPTQVTLTSGAITSISGVATQILWATNDGPAFQNAMNAGAGIWIPAGTYWIGSVLNPGARNYTVRGEGMQNTILAFDNGTSTTQDTGNWTPLFKGNGGLTSEIEFEDFQTRGILDFGRTNVGAAAFELNNYVSLIFDRTKFYQIPFMAMQNEGEKRFTVTNSIFDTVMRDQARCRSCFSVRIIGNKFIHSDDDSVALHQANFIQGPGLIRESIVVEGNDFEDTNCIDIAGGREVVINGNSFRRCKFYAVTLGGGSSESPNQMRNIQITNNNVEDLLTRIPFTGAAFVYGVEPFPPNAITGVTSFFPGSNNFPSAYFGKPWDYDLNSAVPGVAFAPSARIVNFSHNTYLRTLPATPNYSAWGFGQMLSSVGFIDPPVPTSVMYPTTGISAGVNVSSLTIDHNQIQNTRRGLTLTDAVAAPSQATVSITFNHLFDTWEYGIYGTASGSVNSIDIIGNNIDVDPYGVSPGRSGSGGAWLSAYSASRVVALSYTTPAMFALNTFSDAYQANIASYWVSSNNIARGTQFSGVTGQPTWTSGNQGFGVFPTNYGNQTFINQAASSPTGTAPGALGTGQTGHVLFSAAAPTTGYHVIGDIIWSTAPGTCTCLGWVAKNTGSTWVSGTDYGIVALN